MARCENWWTIRALTMSAAFVLGGCGSESPLGPLEEEHVDTATESLTFAERSAACAVDPRVVAGLVSQAVCVGADLFFRETFDGNGRTCSTCHRVENNYTIDPTFIATLPQSDPLFVAENVPALATLENSPQLRANGLIHENVDGLSDPNNKFVLRGVPHILAMSLSIKRPGSTFGQDSTSPPEDRTGWSGDGAPGQGRLKDFATGAVTQHFTKSLNRTAGTDFRAPSEDELNALDAFQRVVGRMNEISIGGLTFTDSGAANGKGLFINATQVNGFATGGCPRCHGSVSAQVQGVNRSQNTGVEGSRSSALAGFPLDGGFLATANADGSFGNGTFNVPPLLESVDTGPFFHTETAVTGASGNNTTAATTIEQAISFYDTTAFNNSPGAAQGKIDQTAAQTTNVGRFLRVLNAAMNIAMTVKRLDGARTLAVNNGNSSLTTQQTLLALAREELDDAASVLASAQGTSLNSTSQTQLATARTAINDAIAASASATRITKIDDAKTSLSSAATGLGTGMTFTIGEGTLMF